QDYEQAAKYYAKAAGHGSAAGMYNLARLTDLGLGVKKDHDMALKLFEQAATQSTEHPKFKDRPNVGVAEAENALGLRYSEGVGVHKNPAHGVRWYHRAVEHGNAEAANSLALMYQVGKGVEKNLEKAEQLFTFSARRGDPNAMRNFAEILLDKNDFEMAQTWFNRACESGSVLAQIKRADFETTLREKKQLMASCPSNVVPMLNAVKNAWNSLKTSKSICELSKGRSKYDFNVLSKYANQGSITAKRLCNALEHFFIALTILIESDTLTEQQEDTLVHELAECYRLEDIVAQFSDSEMREKVGKIVDEVLRRCREMPDYPASQLDEDARVTIIEDAYSWVSCIHLVIEDEHRDCERMFIYNFRDGQGEHHTKKVYTIGSKMHIINPYLRIGGNDMKSYIRIDDFLSIIMQDESERVVNMCRCCGEPNARHVCSRCDKARYCSKECQTMDWKTYNHKLICKKQ
ncbi:unnamed protein product, partial [Rotaria sp. Silwood1]